MNYMNKKKEVLILIISFFGVLLCTFGVYAFNKYVLMLLPLTARIFLMPLVYWLIALIPLLIVIKGKDKVTDYGFTKKSLINQIIIGITLGLALSLVLTVIPRLTGFSEYFDSGKRYKYLWQYIYEFIYCIIAIGFVEELVFRGFFYFRFKRIYNSNLIAIIGSSILFGVFHIFSGNIGQIVTTAILGAVFCLFMRKIKGCSLLSLIIMHGIYDALITVWSNLIS